MLPRKNCGRHKNCALLSVKHTFECRSECDLRLSEANVSAEKSVHGNGLHHVLLYFLDTPELVVRLGVIETCFKIVLPVGIGRECKALCLTALCVKCDKLVRHILDGFLYTGACLLPFV